MTLNQYIYDIKMLLRNNHIVDGDELSDRLIEFWIISQRATWLRRRDKLFIKKDHSISQVFIDSVISIDNSYLPELVESGYKILRTMHKIPEPVNFEAWDGIISTGPIDMTRKRFNHEEYYQAVDSGHGRFNRSQIFTFYLEGYIYLISKSHNNYWHYISQLAVNGIWNDPRKLAEFIHVDGAPCWSEESEYPISLELWAYMKEAIVKQNIDVLLRVPIDISNDANPQKTEQP